MTISELIAKTISDAAILGANKDILVYRFKQHTQLFITTLHVKGVFAQAMKQRLEAEVRCAKLAFTDHFSQTTFITQ